jgi:uncharacterized protein YabE (DUF348 family)/3D (Asp-Asp-Asp) domain-containing protein
MLFMLVTALAVSGITQAKAVYVIYDGSSTATVVGPHYTTSSVLKDAGIEVTAADHVSTDNSGDTTEINITRGQRVYVNYNGATISAYAYQETVKSLLGRLGITLGDKDVVSVDLSEETTDEMIVSVNTVSVKYEVVDEAVPFDTVRTADSSMSAGTEKVTQAGTNGIASVTYAVTVENGEETGRTATNSIVTTPAVSQKVTYGTKASSISSSDRLVNNSKNSDGSGVLTFKSGGTLSYKKVITCTATAYTARAGAHTASGTEVCIGTVAVDPSVIPLGSKLYIQTSDGRIVYGTAVARDTGGGIDGNRVDLFYWSYNECIQFGRRSCSVYVLN